VGATSYPLGTNPEELERLRFQHEVWGGVTRAFLDRLDLPRGARVVDLGCGPGFVTAELATRVGRSGEVLAIDESPRWIEHVEQSIELHGWTHVRTQTARLEDAELDESHHDLCFARWVLSFVADPAAVVTRLARSLRPGGTFAFQDYNHEGVSLFPDSAGFRAVVRATRELYRHSGGDVWVAGRASELFRKAGLELVTLTPNVLCGGPRSPAFRWAGLFFPVFSQRMVDQNLLSAAERASFLTEWSEHERNPDALFFSPIVVDAIARKPA
jgi:ubiquinone/menaquinone biosynthesis C-methylase UbiE